MNNFKIGEIVKVEGIVTYGNENYEVDCIGVIEMINKSNMLITLDEVDRDRKVGCIVKNKYIKSISLVEIGNILTGKNFETKEEFLEYLSTAFEEKLDKFDDAQQAFNDLNNDYSNYLDILGCVYSIFNGEDWNIIGDEKVLNKISITEFKKILEDEKIESISDIEANLTNRIMKNMSNCGIDVYNALKLELEELDDRMFSYFSVYSNGEGPKIELIDDLI